MKMPFGDFKEADKKYWDSVGGRAIFNNNYTSWDDNITSDFREDILKETSLVITKEEHLPHAKQKFVEALDEYAFPFLEKYKDINVFVEHKLTSYYLQYKERKWAFSIKNVIYMLVVLKVTHNPSYEYYKNDMLEILEMQKKNPAIRVKSKEEEDILYECIAYLQTL